MFSSSNLQQESEEMKRLKQEIDRAKREVDKLQKRLSFQEQEHENRVNQLTIRNQSEQKDLEQRQAVQMKNLMQHDSRDLIRDTQKQSDLKRTLAKWETEKQNLTNEIERSFKRGDYPNQDKYTRPQDAIMRSPDMMRLSDRIMKVREEMNQIDRMLSRHQQNDSAAIMRLERYQLSERDKLKTEQQNKLKALEDARLRETQSLKSQMQMYENILRRTESRYRDLERQHKIDMKRRADLESRQRAQHGDTKGRKNYAKAEGENVLDPESAQQANASSRRMGAPKW